MGILAAFPECTSSSSATTTMSKSYLFLSGPTSGRRSLKDIDLMFDLARVQPRPPVRSAHWRRALERINGLVVLTSRLSLPRLMPQEHVGKVEPTWLDRERSIATLGI